MGDAHELSVIDVCPVWEYSESTTQLCGASGVDCDIYVASIWTSCVLFKNLLEVFEEVLNRKDDKNGQKKNCKTEDNE